MARFRYQHIKSSVEGKAPTAAQLKVAEIGVNDFAGDEKLFIKNSTGDVVDFPRGYSREYIDDNERVVAEALNDLNTRKLDASAYTPTDLSNYYQKSETSGATELSDEFALCVNKTEVDQVIDETTSASTNPVSTSAVYSAITENELVWTNAYVVISGAISSHTEDTSMHVTSADKAAWDAKLDASDLDDYYEKTETSGATELETAFNGKANTSDIADFFDDAKYELNGTTHVINFYNGNTIKATIDATDFIKDGMIDSVSLETTGGTTYLVITWNTDAGKSQTSLNVGDLFDADNYYTKTEIDNKLGSGFTVSSVTEVIESNERVISSSLNDLNTRKLDASAYTPTDLSNYYTKSETSGATELSTEFAKYYTTAQTSGATELDTAFGDIDDKFGSGFTVSSVTQVIEENEEIVSEALNDLNARKLDASAYTPTDLTNYYTKSETSGATELQTALAAKQDVLTEGRAIDITNNVVSLDLPISAGTGTNSIIEGTATKASGAYSHAEGYGTSATTSYAHSEGNLTTASGYYSHAEGSETTASGYYSHAEGSETKAAGNSAHAEGYVTLASGNYTHSEGFRVSAFSESSHAEGYTTIASGQSSHVEGRETFANGNYSHAEGYKTSAMTNNSHAEGTSTTASGNAAHAEGYATIASGLRSHAEGSNTIANNRSEHASGQYNISSSASTTFGDSGNTLFSVGNGTADDARHNAFEIRQNGDIYISSGGTNTNPMIKLQALFDRIAYLENKVIYNGHAYVDLGLPSGTKWATMNVGASSETDYGNYYQYGKGVAQYAATSGDSNYSGTEDPLATSADTAAQVWGGSWHMPTQAQIQELTANTTYQWVTNYKGSGINGGTFTATNGAVLFIPAAGGWGDGSQVNVGDYGYYWGSSPNGSNSACYLYFGNGYKYVYNSYREYGYSVRPVVG